MLKFEIDGHFNRILHSKVTSNSIQILYFLRSLRGIVFLKIDLANIILLSFVVTVSQWQTHLCKSFNAMRILLNMKKKSLFQNVIHFFFCYKISSKECSNQQSKPILCY